MMMSQTEDSRPSRARGLGILAALLAAAALVLVPVWTASATSTYAWSVTTRVEPIHSNAGEVKSVSCASSSFCIGVDGAGDFVRYSGAVDSQTGFAVWTTQANIDTAALVGVSCPTSSFCAAVDDQGGALTYNGTQWSAVAGVDQSGTSFNAVSCPTSSFCVAVDEEGSAFTFNGSTWSSGDPVDLHDDGLSSVSCTASSFCVAVSSGGASVTYNGTSWSTPDDFDIEHFVTSVSCASSTFCDAVDAQGNVFTYNGSAWSGADSIDPNGQGISTVSCSSATFCIAGDHNSDVVMYSATGWSAPQGEDSSRFNSISCVAGPFCAATDDVGNARFYQGTVQLPPVTHTGTLKLSGNPLVGSTLSASPGTGWTPSDATFQYAWVRLRPGHTAGDEIGAIGQTYKLTSADLGSRVYALVGGSKAGYAPGYAETALSAVVKAPTSLTVAAKPAKKKVTLTITVKAAGPVPTGTVAIKSGSKVLKTVALKNGKGTVKLTGKKGRHTYTIVYAGNSVDASRTVIEHTKMK
jgi:hypothetical protein